MSDLTVSVVIPTWNSAGFLPATLDAVLGQSAPPCEVIVVDDGSTDDTPIVLEPYLDRITYVRQPNFGGPSRPRNVGVAHATGDLVAFCDSDDLLTPDSLSFAMAAFTSTPEIDFLWGDYDLINAGGGLIRSRGMDTYQEFRQDFRATDRPELSLMTPGTMYPRLLRGLFLGISSVVVRRQVLADAGPFDEGLRNSDDREMWMRIARHGATFAYQDGIRFQYRIHEGSVTNRGHLRMPSVISNLERQVPHLTSTEDLAFVKKRINGCRLVYARGLRLDGDLAGAESAYRQALAEAPSFGGLKGIVLTRLLRVKSGLTR